LFLGWETLRENRLEDESEGYSTTFPQRCAVFADT